MIRLRWLIALALFLGCGECAKILVYMCQTARSHHIVFHPVIRELAARGHEVDYYTHVPMKNPPKTLNQIVFPFGERTMQFLEDEDFFEMSHKPIVQGIFNAWSIKAEAGPFCTCFNDTITKELLVSDKKYDMVIGEFLFHQEDYTVFIHKFNALGVTMSSLPDVSWIREMSGLPDNPSYMVSFFSMYTDHMNFFQRLSNFFTWSFSLGINYYFTMGPIQKLADKELAYEGSESRPSINKLMSNMALFLVNSHHSLGYPYPSAPHVKEILGTNIDEKPEPLPKELQEYMDSAEHGIVYFSMGSIISIKHLRRAGIYEPLIHTLSKLKEKVLWKWTSWSGEEMPQISNIKMSKWLPQQSILAHNKTKLFITHGGLGSMTESVYHSVPVLGIPVFADQNRNIKCAATAGMGIEMEWTNITKAGLTWAINEILNNPQYKEQAQIRSRIFVDRLMKPVDEAVYWIEYVLKYGRVLQPAAVHMPFYQLYLLDVMGFLIVSFAGALFIIKKTLVIILRVVKGEMVKKTHLTKEESKKRR